MKARGMHLPSATSRQPGLGCVPRMRGRPDREREQTSGGRGAPGPTAGGGAGIPGVFLGGVLVFLVVFHLSWVPEARVGHRLGVASVRADVLLREAEDGSILARQNAVKPSVKKLQARASRWTSAPKEAPEPSLRPVASHRLPKGIHSSASHGASARSSIPPSVTGRSGAIIPVAYSKGPDQWSLGRPPVPAPPREPGRSETPTPPAGPPAEVTDLRGADLRGADLTGAKLAWAKLTGAKLEGARLQGAALTEADLWLADLRGADLTGARLTAPQRPGLPRPDAALEAHRSGGVPPAADPREVPAILPASVERNEGSKGEEAF